MQPSKQIIQGITGSLLLLFLYAPVLRAQEKVVCDPEAMKIFTRMSKVIGGLSACSFSLNTSVDRFYLGKTYTENNSNEVNMAGPDKMLVNVDGDKGRRCYYYNGKSLNFYSYDENNYASVGAPPTILETFDSLHATYGIDFPAADFFYPDFAEDLARNSESIEYTGIKEIAGEKCFHILARNKDLNVQIWLLNDATMLPKKVVINYINGKSVKRYEADFSGWKLNPQLPANLFEFSVPPNAKLVYLMPQKKR